MINNEEKDIRCLFYKIRDFKNVYLRNVFSAHSNFIFHIVIVLNKIFTLNK